MGFSLWCWFCMYLQFSKVCEIWVLLNVTELVFHCGGDFACIFSSSGFANFVSHWVQLNGFTFQCQFYVFSVQQGLQISSHIEGNWMGFSFQFQIFMYFQFSRVCEFPVTLRATEWVFHYSANFHVSSVQQSLWNLSLIECN